MTSKNDTHLDSISKENAQGLESFGQNRPELALLIWDSARDDVQKWQKGLHQRALVTHFRRVSPYIPSEKPFRL